MNINSMGKAELRAACKAVGIPYGKLTVQGMRDTLAAQAESATVVTTVAGSADPSAAPTVAPAAAVIPDVLNPATVIVREERNGVRRPIKGVCADVWSWMDDHPNATTEELRAIAAQKKWNINNALIERSGYRRFHGLNKAAPAPHANA